MKKFSIIFLSALALISLNSCRKIVGEGPVVTESRNTSDFTGIHYSVPGQLVYEPGDVFSIKIDAQQNILNVIETYVSNHELRIKVRDNTIIRSGEDIRVTVTAPPVTALEVSGSGTIHVLQHYAPESVKLQVSGSGKILLNSLETGHVKTKISGSGQVQALNGSATHEDISISGSGQLDFLNVMAIKAVTHTSGSGTIKLGVSDELDTHISGSGTVYYKGEPIITSSISGSGRLVKL
ncbi:MAG: head GIN domain-containing protein [Flavitalea sp.]